LSNGRSESYYSDLENSARLNSSLSITSDSNNASLSSTDAAAYNINNTTDGKFSNNSVKPLLAINNVRKPAIDAVQISDVDLSSNTNDSSTISSKFSNIESSSKFKDLKSANMGFLSSDKNSRLVSKIHTSKGQFNLSDKNSNLADIMSQISSEGSLSSELAIYNSANND
jgi:hypothetical protein